MTSSTIEGGVLRTTGAGEVFVPEGSAFADYLAKKRGHDPAVHYFIEKHRARLHPFFDVGAHVGIFSIIAARTGAVFSFEPDPLNRSLFAANVVRHGVSPTLVPVAVAAKDGELVMAPMPCGLSQAAVPHRRAEAVRIPARSLASFCDEAGVVPGFIKIDVEGGELGVMEGMGQALARSIVEMEFSWRDHGAKLSRFTNIRPLSLYDWTFAIGAEDAAILGRNISPIDFQDCGLFEYKAETDADLLAICDVLRERTAERASRKWEVCITSKSPTE